MIGYLFAGQGTQYVGMGKDFYEKNNFAKHLYDSMTMDFSIPNVCFYGPETTLNDTAYTQSCILATSFVISSLLKDAGYGADIAAGLSLGEYSALTYAQAIKLPDALEIVRQRGQIMAHALPPKTTKMAAVLHCDIATIQTVCEAVSHDGQICTIANDNCPGQIVISGTNQAVDEACAQLPARCVPLKVSGAFHSPLLACAASELHKVLQRYTFAEPKIPIVYNGTGQVGCDDLVDTLTRQIKQTVQFRTSIETMMQYGVQTWIEIGPGYVLSKFVKRIDPDAKVFSIDSYDDFLEVVHGK